MVPHDAPQPASQVREEVWWSGAYRAGGLKGKWMDSKCLPDCHYTSETETAQLFQFKSAHAGIFSIHFPPHYNIIAPWKGIWGAARETVNGTLAAAFIMQIIKNTQRQSQFPPGWKISTVSAVHLTDQNDEPEWSDGPNPGRCGWP